MAGEGHVAPKFFCRQRCSPWCFDWKVNVIVCCRCCRVARLQKITRILYSIFSFDFINCPLRVFVLTLKWSKRTNTTQHSFSDIIILMVHCHPKVLLSFCCGHIHWMCWGPKKQLSSDLLWVSRASQVGPWQSLGKLDIRCRWFRNPKANHRLDGATTL